MNLTNIPEPREVAIRHMADSLFLLQCAEFNGKKVLDIGTGAGFPGVPLLLAADDLEITMLDSTQKRIDFINESIEKIGDFPKATAIAGRAEEVALLKNHREKYDIVVSRAVAPMNILCELALPFLKKGGVFLAMKSANDEGKTEVNAALGAIKVLGGKVNGEIDYSLSFDSPKRRIVTVEKIKETPSQYPRKYPKIKAKPLS